MEPEPNSQLIATPEAMTAFGATLAAQLRRGVPLCLAGPLGAGKTTLSAGIIRALMGPDEDVTSPTYTLVHIYETPQGPLWHCDLYRLEADNDIAALGLDEAMEEALCLIEWPDRLGNWTPVPRLDVVLTPQEDGSRRIEITEVLAA